MDNEMDSIIPEAAAGEAPKVESSVTKKPKVLRKPKPLLEGINAPKTTQSAVIVKSNLSEKEQELVSGQEIKAAPAAVAVNRPQVRLMPESVSKSLQKKDHHLGRWTLIFVVLLILVAGGYEYYVWQLSKGQAPVLGHYHPVSDPSINTQPFPLAGGTAPTTSSSTINSAPSSAPGSTTTPSSTAATGTVLQVKINSTPTGYLNVRDTPSSSGKVVTQVHPGEVYSYTKVQNNWYQITYSGFSQGWVSGQYVTKK